MNNYKIKVNGTHPLEYQDILDVASELGYDNEDWGNLYNVNYLFLNDDGSVGFSLNGEAVSDEHQELTLPQLRDLVAQSKSEEQGLISGADALQALMDRKDVQVHESTYKKEIWFDLKKTKFTPSEILEEKVRDKPYKLTFRFKPSTIKLELEIPAPFEPKEGEEFYYLDSRFDRGFNKTTNLNGAHEQFGCWKTEEDARHAVAALREIKG